MFTMFYDTIWNNSFFFNKSFLTVLLYVVLRMFQALIKRTSVHLFVVNIFTDNAIEMFTLTCWVAFLSTDNRVSLLK